MRVMVGKYTAHVGFLGLLLILATIHFYQKGLLAYTGDEPRFVYYSYSIAKGKMLKYPVKQFMEEAKSQDPTHIIIDAPITLNIFNKNMFMMNSIIAPLMYAPALAFGKSAKAMELLRSAAFIYYCGALIFMWLSLRSIFSAKESLIALILTTLALPQLAQMSLGNTEQAAIFFLAAALYFLIFRQITIFSVILGTISVCMLVYASMRSFPIAFFIALGFMVRLYTVPSSLLLDKKRYLFLFFIIGLLGSLGWILMQYSFTGTLIGSSRLNEDLSDKNVLWFLYRLFVPMLHHRDGILLLFPLVFCSMLGLMNAARKYCLLAWVCLGAWAAYYFLISLTWQSEGYPGRLQFILVEFFIIGLAFYIRDFKNVASIALLVMGVIMSSIMVYYYFISPSLLVANREFGLFQQIILEKTHLLDFGKYLIWDKHSVLAAFDMPIFIEQSWHVGLQVFFFLTVIGVLLFISILNRYSVLIRSVSMVAVIGMLFVGIASVVMVPLPAKKVNITQVYKEGYGSIKLGFKKPIQGKVTITFGAYPFWQAPEVPSFFLVMVETEDGIIKEYRKRSIPEIRLSDLKNVKSIMITGDKAQLSWSTRPLKVYISPFV